MRYPNNKNRRVDKKMRRFFVCIKKMFIFAVIKYSVIKIFAYDIKA